MELGGLGYLTHIAIDDSNNNGAYVSVYVFVPREEVDVDVDVERK